MQSDQPAEPSTPGAFFRQLIAGSRFGLSLPDCPDETVAWFLACAIADAMNGQLRLDNLHSVVVEAKKRNLSQEMFAEALLKRAELK